MLLAALALGRAAAQIPPSSVMVPPPIAAPSTAQPNQHIYRPRAGAPPSGEWIVRAVSQTTDGPWRHLRGHAELESAAMLFRADELDWNSETGDVTARGNLYFEEFERNEKIWAESMD
jgi:hypothetical protein